MSAYGGKAYAREFPAEFPLTAVKRKSVNGSNLKKADNLRTRLNHDRQSQFSVVSGPGFEPAIERQGSDNWENNFPVNSLILHSNSLFRRVGNLAKIAREFRGL